MAIKKANTLHPPQSLNPQPAAGPMPVKTHVYHTFAELNSAFEKVILDLGNLKEITYFRSEALRAMYKTLVRIRAQVSREFISVLSEREVANALPFRAPVRAGRVGLSANRQRLKRSWIRRKPATERALSLNHEGHEGTRRDFHHGGTEARRNRRATRALVPQRLKPNVSLAFTAGINACSTP